MNELQIGRFNRLEIVKSAPQGLYLDGGDDGEILLPTRYLPEAWGVGESLEVFIYLDSEDRLIATTETPLAQVGEFAYLKVTSIAKVGAFLDWGLPKDLFLPYREQTRELRVGQGVVVFLYLDNTGRIASTMRVQKYVEPAPESYRPGQEVELLVADRTDLGFKAVVDNCCLGMLYADEIFQPIKYGQRLQGFVKKVRPGGKLDVSLQRTGMRAARDVSETILALLRKESGFLPMSDQTPPELIHDIFGVSKKKFKMALGNLYKQGLITLDDDGIRLKK